MKTNSLDFDAQALREKILDLAMRGKLVEQNPDDEPASVLLEKIKAEKEQLIKEKKIKKSKALPPISDDEKPFDIPDSWEWVRLGEVFDITSSKRVMKSEWCDSGIPFYRAREIVSIKNNRSLKDPIFIDKKTYFEKIKISGKPKVNDILLTGVGTLGVPYIVPDEKEFYFKDGNIIWLKNFGKLNSEFLSYYVQCPYMLKEINNGRGTTVATLTIVRSSNLIIPIPPLEEQSRIAVKIAQLFALLRKVESSIQQYTKLQTLLKLKVLDVAMRGKLVEQDPNDEPASVLLEKIKAEKDELVKENKIKKSKPLPPISDAEKPFDIPDTWEWVRLGEMLYNLDGHRIPVSIADRKKRKKIYDYYGASGIIDKIDNYIFSKTLLLISEDGANLLSRTKPIAFIATGKYWVNNHAHIFDAYKEIILRYTACYINSINISKYVSGTAQPKLNQQNMNKIIIPLPPLEEQKRIVTKIAQLSIKLGN